MSFQVAEKSLTSGEPYELHEFYEGILPYPTLLGTSAQADPGLTHTVAISNVTELQAMNDDKTANYYLTQDIDASATSGWNGGAGFEPIGDATYFTGSFDGCGYKITDLFINRNANGQGLFGYVGEGAQIANVWITSADIKSGGYYGALLAAYVRSGDAGDVLIQNCRIFGNLAKHASAGGMGYYGGLIGRILRKGGDSSGTTYIYDCSAAVELDMDSCTIYSNRGGFVGVCAYAVISNCFANGSLINGEALDAGQSKGGFAGAASNDVAFSFCYSTGDVVGGGGRLFGGFIGFTSQDTTFDSCYATGDVSGDQEVGGFAGYAEGTSGDVDFNNCYAWGDATATGAAGRTGGFCGVAEEATISFDNCYSVGAATADAFEGGFIGKAGANTPVTDCFWDTEASGNATTSQDKGDGHVTSWMKKQINYEDAGWDFSGIWKMDLTKVWRFADAPKDVTYDGYIYSKCWCPGGGIEQGPNVIKSRTTIKLNWNNPFVWQYTIAQPNDVIRYNRYKGHGNNIQLAFTGDVIDVQFKQTSRQGDRYAEITIEPPRASLGRMGLITRYSRQCTVELYSDSCGVSRTTYITSGTLDSVAANVLTSTTFGTESNGYWEGGDIYINSRQAKIVEHTGDDVTILPYIYGLAAGDTFEVYPGCNHIFDEDCVNIFSNGANCKCQPNIPLLNLFGDGSIYK